MPTHKCPYGDFSCGMFGYNDLCSYCKRKADLELELQRVEMNGQQERQVRESRQAANEAVARVIVDNPVASLVGFLGAVGVGALIARADSVSERRALAKGKKKK